MTTQNALAEIMQRPYTRIVVPAEEGGFVAEVLEFEGCFAEGDSPEEVMTELEGAMRDWIELALEAGQPIPEPLGAREYSGRLVLRMPSSLHERAARRAAIEGVSLNQLLTTAIAGYLGPGQQIDQLADAIAERLRASEHVAAAPRFTLRA